MMRQVDFGTWLRRRRVLRCCTLAELAEATGYSSAYLSRVERLEVPPPPIQRPCGGESFYNERAATLLGVRPAFLRRRAKRARRTLLEGVPWHRRKR